MGQAGGGGISPFKWRVRHRACNLIENDSWSRWAHGHTGWRVPVQKNPPRPSTHTALFLFPRTWIKIADFLEGPVIICRLGGVGERVRGLKLRQDKNLTNSPERFCQFVLTTHTPPSPRYIGCSLIVNFFSLSFFVFVFFPLYSFDVKRLPSPKIIVLAFKLLSTLYCTYSKIIITTVQSTM